MNAILFKIKGLKDWIIKAEEKVITFQTKSGPVSVSNKSKGLPKFHLFMYLVYLFIENMVQVIMCNIILLCSVDPCS